MKIYKCTKRKRTCVNNLPVNEFGLVFSSNGMPHLRIKADGKPIVAIDIEMGWDEVKALARRLNELTLDETYLSG